MKTKEEILTAQEAIVFDLLKTKYKFIHDQLALEAKPHLIEKVKRDYAVVLQEIMRDGIESDPDIGVYVSADFDETCELFSGYQASLALVEEVYGAKE